MCEGASGLVDWCPRSSGAALARKNCERRRESEKEGSAMMAEACLQTPVYSS